MKPQQPEEPELTKTEAANKNDMSVDSPLVDGGETSDGHQPPVATAGPIEQIPVATSRRHAWLIVGMVILLALAALLAVHSRADNKAVNTQQSQASKQPLLTSANQQVCGLATIKAILCENVTNHTVTKLTVPQGIGPMYGVEFSPSGDKILLRLQPNHVTDKASQKFLVVDRHFKVIKQLPDAPEGTDGFGYVWSPDSKKLIYDMRQLGADSQYGRSQLYNYDLATGKSTQLTHWTDGVYIPRIYKDGNIIAVGEVSNDDPNAPRKPEELLMVSAKDGSVKVIDTTAFRGSDGDASDRILYEPASGYFYMKAAQYESGKPPVKYLIGSLQSDAKGLSLKREKALTMTDLDTSMITTKGILVHSQDVGKTAYSLYAGQDNGQEKLKLTGDTVSLTFATPRLPFDTVASDNRLVTADYLYEYQTPPQRLHDFLTKRLTDGCKTGETRMITLDAFDGDQQAAVSEGSCNLDGTGSTTYYIYKNGAYQSVYSTQEGVDCDVSAKLGLSKVVLPSCVPAGQR